ncbi:MAG: sulfatase-like hydrolase/transferase [Algoriphagus sp.]|jgi:arylsulfatase A-like enzyme|uniref:sulfatase family protein n=1 Tax=Algoriphagus sp. TaxID=1872435 RepID=UPI0026203CE0|nr:sulfatase-like hydrolase/transferase [Algoriphagus sp.]MDG1278302.1 sulfatase-like hydrolase/transferase [Algoriphagus sp.]
MKTKNANHLKFFLLIGVFFGNICSPFAQQINDELPNVVLLLGDDHGWDETGYNGHPYLKTPVLDELAEVGVRMNRFYSASPVCSPTRGSILTGRHPNRYGTFTPGYSIRPEEISIASLMQQKGYATAHFGKWHLGPVKAESPTNPGAMGFDEWLSHDNFFELNPYLSKNGADPELFEGESSEILVREAMDFIEKAKAAGKPFFVVIWYGSPHEPYSGLPEDMALYSNLPETFATKEVRLTSNETGLPVTRLQRDVLQERFAEITAMDRSIGELRNYLDAKELKSNTLLWYFGDNGTPQEANATVPFREQKGSIYEGGIRVPSVLEWPAGLPSALESNVIMNSEDVFPTLAFLIGEELPNRPIDGINLMPFLSGEKLERPSPMMFWNGSPRDLPLKDQKPYLDPKLQEGTSPMVKLMNGKATRDFRNYIQTDIITSDFQGDRAIIDNRYKLVLTESKSGETQFELFDLLQDPAETNDLKELYPELTKKMNNQLRIWQESVLNSLLGNDYKMNK